MNLENLNLVELNAQEVQETEGGFIPLVLLGVACFDAFAIGTLAGIAYQAHLSNKK
jgi:lactobin A/cerein 7B family class IIb bacteriocin